MESIYLLRLAKAEGGNIHFLLKYNQHGDLVHVEIKDINDKLAENQRNWIWDVFLKKTITETYLSSVPANFKGKVKLTKIESDLSFDAFWNLYDHKLGNKKRAKEHWDKLSETRKAMVMEKVKQYNFYMLHQSHSKVFAERFLAQKRYENDFTIKS